MNYWEVLYLGHFRMTMKHINGRRLRTGAVVCVCLLHFGLSGYLLASTSYFGVRTGNWDADCGLLGLTKDEVYSSYQDEIQRCTKDVNELCVFLPDLEAGGSVLFALLCLSATLEVLNLVYLLSIKSLVIRVVQTVECSHTVSRSTKACVYLLWFTHYMSLLDPAVLLAGVVAWTVRGRLGALGTDCQVDMGVAVGALVCKVGVALAATAVQVLAALSNWRVNRRSEFTVPTEEWKGSTEQKALPSTLEVSLS